MHAGKDPYAHFLITLFNLALWPQDKAKAPTRTREWLDSRCRLFERWCLPSVAAQQGARFRWLVMFDADTPHDVRARIEQWQKTCPAMEPCFFTAEEVSGFTGRSTGRQVRFINRAMRERMSGEEKWILTTNLDNDDALASDAMHRIEQAFEADRRQKVISLVNGLQLFPSEMAVMGMRYPHNHFLTLCEPVTADSEAATVESMSHRQARRLYAIDDIGGAPGWIEVVHANNISNDLRITSRISYRLMLHAVSLRPFGIDMTLTRGAQLCGTARLIMYFFKVAAWRLHRKILHHR